MDTFALVNVLNLNDFQQYFTSIKIHLILTFASHGIFLLCKIIGNRITHKTYTCSDFSSNLTMGGTILRKRYDTLLFTIHMLIVFLIFSSIYIISGLKNGTISAWFFF